MKKIRVLHISTAHQPQDPRVVFKQCQTLTKDYDVFCAIPHGNSAIAPAIHFIQLPYFQRVLLRILVTCPLILLRCLWLRPKVVHVYVPEFLPFAYVFQLFGARVIYEVQENLHKKMHLRTINNSWLLTKAFFFFDQLARRHFYFVFTEHGYLTTYYRLAKPWIVIYNYPLLNFIEPFRKPYHPNPKQPSFLYIGWLSFNRAFDTLVESLAQLREVYPDFCLHLFGRRQFTDAELAKLPHYHTVQQHIRFHGYTDQRIAFPYANGATVGLALLKPVGDYEESYPTKLFDYMALGLPVITSNFPLYQSIVDRHRCGFCVSPYHPDQVTERLTYLIEHPDEARAMGERGRQAVEQFYNWTTEASKLTDFYELILRKA